MVSNTVSGTFFSRVANSIYVEFAYAILRSLRTWEVLQDVPSGELITDAKNPLARLQIHTAESHFTAMNELIPAEVWLH